MYHVFAYLNKYHDSELVIDPSDKVFDQDEFECQYWTSSDFGHVSGKEDLTLNMPDTRDLGFLLQQRLMQTTPEIQSHEVLGQSF